jgi:glycosyltransferase involved in cell wall biosynthesis
MRSFHILTDSKKTEGRLISDFGFENQRVSPVTLFPAEALSLISQRERKIKESQKRYLIYPANFWLHKNHRILIEALRYNNERKVESYKLVFTGFDMGFKTRLIELIEINDLKEQIEIYDFVSRDIMLNLYRESEGLVYPSLLGPTNIPPLEALMLGIPVTVAKDSAVNLRDFKGVTALDPFDSKVWAKALKLPKSVKLSHDAATENKISRMHLENKKALSQILKKIQLQKDVM